MMSYQLTPSAETDVEGIWDYLANDSIEIADRVVGSIKSAFDLIGRNPGVGHVRRDLTAQLVLFWPVGSYLVIYREFEQRVEVLAVVHGARDNPLFLAERAPNP